MRHDWIINVLTDLQTYAETNDLPATAMAAAHALDVAMDELAGLDAGDQVDLPPRTKRPN